MEFSAYPGYEEFINQNNNPIPNQSPEQNNQQPLQQPTQPSQQPSPPPIQQTPPTQENNTQSIINKILSNDSIANRQLNTNLLNNQNYNQNPNKPIVNQNIEPEKGKKFSVKLLVLGLIIALSVGCALAWNEVARYYIGRSIKFYNGKPIYYIYYSMGVSVLTLLVYLYCASYM